MIKKIVWIGFISLFMISCKSNYTKIGDKNANYIPYYIKVYKADSLYVVKDYKRSYEILDSLFKKYQPVNMSLYFEYENYVKMSARFDKVKKKDVKNLVKYYDYRLEEIQKDTLLSIAFNKTKFTEKKINRLHASFIKNVDTVYRNLINQMNFRDQEIRVNGEIDWNEVRNTDLENDSLLKIQLEKKGFPNIKKVGSWKKIKGEFTGKNVDLEVIFNHLSSYDCFDYYEAKIYSFVKTGLCAPKVFGRFIDKRSLKDNRESYYYFIPFDLNIQKNKSADFIKEINSRRKKNGLPSVEYDLYWYNYFIHTKS